MTINTRILLGNLCSKRHQRRAQQASSELEDLLRDYAVPITPLVTARIEEFLVLYHVVQGIEDRIRADGLFATDVPAGKRGKAKRSATRDAGASTTGGESVDSDVQGRVPERLHPLIDAATKQRERLNKSIKEIEALITAHATAHPLSLSELLAPLMDKDNEKAAA